jgi:hypothetical protein
VKTSKTIRSFVILGSATALTACAYHEDTASVARPATVIVAPATTERVVFYPEGRYELRGAGTAASPAYWVWIPASTSSPEPPPLRRPQTQ